MFKIVLYIFSISLLLSGCKFSREIKTTNINYDLKKYSVFYTLEKPVLMQLISYNPSCECGIRMCGSISIGITNNDTIRVITPCNSDTTFKIGMFVKVSPIEKSDIELTYSLGYVEGQKMDVLPIHRMYLKTYYGKIEHSGKGGKVSD